AFHGSGRDAVARHDEDRVVPGDRAGHVRKARAVQGLRKGVRRTGRRADHQELIGRHDRQGELAKGVRQQTGRRDWGRFARTHVANPLPVVDPGEPELLDVAGDRRLRGRKAEPLESRPNLLLTRQAAGGHELEDRLLAPDLGRGGGAPHRTPSAPAGASVPGGGSAPADACGGSAAIVVPTPSGVNSSSTSACSTRPSSRWIRGTPPSSARAAASSFGIMPPCTTAPSRRRSATSRDPSSESSSPPRPSTPGTSL